VEGCVASTAGSTAPASGPSDGAVACALAACCLARASRTEAGTHSGAVVAAAARRASMSEFCLRVMDGESSRVESASASSDWRDISMARRSESSTVGADQRGCESMGIGELCLGGDDVANRAAPAALPPRPSLAVSKPLAPFIAVAPTNGCCTRAGGCCCVGRGDCAPGRGAGTPATAVVPRAAAEYGFAGRARLPTPDVLGTPDRCGGRCVPATGARCCCCVDVPRPPGGAVSGTPTFA